MGFTRRFASRVDSDNPLNDEENGVEEIPTLSARIEEKQKRPYSSSKVYPQTDDSEIGRAESERQNKLHTKICIFLCTVLPFVTLVATIHRLWFMGMIDFEDVATVEDCPDEWVLWEGNCYFYMPHPQPWSHALSTCSRLESSELVDISSEEEDKFLQKMTASSFWTGGRYSRQGWKWEPGGWPFLYSKLQDAKTNPTKRKKKTSNVLTVRDNTFSGASTARTRTSSYSDTSKLNNGAHSALGSIPTVASQPASSSSSSLQAASTTTASVGESPIHGLSTEIFDMKDFDIHHLNHELSSTESPSPRAVTAFPSQSTTPWSAAPSTAAPSTMGGTTSPVTRDKEFSRHLDIEECLAVSRGQWRKVECSRKRGFICKFPVSGRIKREKVSCKKKKEINLYNRNLYVVCQDFN